MRLPNDRGSVEEAAGDDSKVGVGSLTNVVLATGAAGALTSSFFSFGRGAISFWGVSFTGGTAGTTAVPPQQPEQPPQVS